MLKAIFRFYEELNKFLPKHRRKTDFQVNFKGRRSIKLLKFKEVTHAIFVGPGTTGEQIKRIIDYLDITWVKRFNVHGSRLKSPNSLLIKG